MGLALVGFLTTVPRSFAGDTVLPLPTNIENFYMRGTQPNSLASEITPAVQECFGCHQGEGSVIYAEWSGSLMAQSARDPVFYACLDIAEADAPGSGDTCIRCHVPKAWLEGRSTPTDGSAIQRVDRDGITCHVCHRMVDPFDPDMDAPEIDELILLELGADRPLQSTDLGTPAEVGNGGNANYVIDPYDRRRGPFPVHGNDPDVVECDPFHFSFTFGECEDDLGDPTGCPTFESPLHRRSDMCATCHDVSLPHFSFNTADNRLEFNGGGVPHPNGNKYEMAPEQRTYSEWLKSEFAVGDGVDMMGRFGAPGQTLISDCQDCHMSAHTAKGCAFVANERDDIPHHTFSGASTWVLEAIALHYGPDGPLQGFPPPLGGFDFDEDVVMALQAQKLLNIEMLQLAADLDAALDDSQTPGTDQLKITVTNQTGHKLPTGYIEGRRVWLTIEYFDCDMLPILTLGGYDARTAELDEATTKVYHAELGPDDELAAQVNLPAGPSPHAVFGNKMYYDNRIPPRGFTNAGFAAIQAAPVNYSYADGQYWDDTYYDIPAAAVGARITLNYQATSKEYIEFLRDNNPHTDDPTNAGELAYALWEEFDKSPPVVMAVIGDEDLFPVGPKGDTNCDSEISGDDIPDFIDALIGVAQDRFTLHAADMNDNGVADGDDVQAFLDLLLE